MITINGKPATFLQAVITAPVIAAAFVISAVAIIALWLVCLALVIALSPLILLIFLWEVTAFAFGAGVAACDRMKRGRSGRE